MKYTNKILAGMLIFIGAALLLFGLTISEALYPGYHVTQVISDLGVGSTAWLFNSTIFVFGVLILISAYLMLNIHMDRYFTLLLCVTGAGALLVGLIPVTYGLLHIIVAGVVFVSAGFCAISGYNVFRGPFALLSPIFGCITLIATGLFALNIYIGLDIGGMERMIVYPLIIWALGAGAYLMSPGN